jgi:hypothetical protein
VSFQITVLKVLAGHPDGRLSVDNLKRAVAILMCSGPDWTDRTKRLLARATDLDIFSQALVVCDAHGWQITDAGRALLAAIENPAAFPIQEVPENTPKEPMYSTSAPLPMHHVGRRKRRSRRRRRAAARQKLPKLPPKPDLTRTGKTGANDPERSLNPSSP